MRLVSAATTCFVGGAVVAVSGCFAPPNYGYPQPGIYQQPIQTLQPSGTYVPGSGTYAPGTSIQSTPPGSSGSLTPLDGGNAPTYSGPTGSTGSSGTQSRPVPNPPAAGSPFYDSSNVSGQTFQNPIPTTPSQQYNPPATNPPVTSPPTANPTGNPFGSSPPAGTQEIYFQGQQTPSMLEVRNGPQMMPTVTAAYETEDQVDPSLSIAAHTVERVVFDSETTFDHDREEFAWLRGIVSFDESDASWNIVYSDAPDSSDPYAGFLTLLNHPDFDAMNDGTEVIVYGTVDPILTDDLGRPMYVVTRVVPADG